MKILSDWEIGYVHEKILEETDSSEASGDFENLLADIHKKICEIKNISNGLCLAFVGFSINEKTIYSFVEKLNVSHVKIKNVCVICQYSKLINPGFLQENAKGIIEKFHARAISMSTSGKYNNGVFHSKYLIAYSYDENNIVDIKKIFLCSFNWTFSTSHGGQKKRKRTIESVVDINLEKLIHIDKFKKNKIFSCLFNVDQVTKSGKDFYMAKPSVFSFIERDDVIEFVVEEKLDSVRKVLSEPPKLLASPYVNKAGLKLILNESVDKYIAKKKIYFGESSDKKIHAKFIVGDKYFILGSSNLTEAAWLPKNNESLYLYDKKVDTKELEGQLKKLKVFSNKDKNDENNVANDNDCNCNSIFIVNAELRCESGEYFLILSLHNRKKMEFTYLYLSNYSKNSFFPIDLSGKFNANQIRISLSSYVSKPSFRNIMLECLLSSVLFVSFCECNEFRVQVDVKELWTINSQEDVYENINKSNILKASSSKNKYKRKSKKDFHYDFRKIRTCNSDQINIQKKYIEFFKIKEIGKILSIDWKMDPWV